MMSIFKDVVGGANDVRSGSTTRREDDLCETERKQIFLELH